MNLATIAVIEKCLGLEPGLEKPAVYDGKSEECKLLCGTPNGGIVVNLLKDHAKSFGLRGIGRVSVMWSAWKST